MFAMFLFLVEETARGAAESMIVNVVLWLKLAIETTSAIVIGSGVLIALYEFARAPFSRRAWKIITG